MQQQTLANLAIRAAGGRRRGITSICSAHPFVIEAALKQAAEDRDTVLIEATCNQVNHDGGYTGMTPAAFRDFVFAIAEKVGLPRDRILLGGDHLGPNPWKGLPADEAMQESECMVAAYVEAGFTKIHLDTSMACRGDPVRFPKRRSRPARRVSPRSRNARRQPPASFPTTSSGPRCRCRAVRTRRSRRWR